MSVAARSPVQCPAGNRCARQMNAQALVPIGEQLHRAITEQQAVVTGDLGASAPFLLPRPTKNPDGGPGSATATAVARPGGHPR